MPDLASLTISVDPRQAAEIERLFAQFPREMTAAATRALNHTAGVGRTLTIKTIRGDLNVAAGAIRGEKGSDKGVTVDRATWSNLQAVIRITGSRLPLIRFGARPNDPSLFAGDRARSQRGVSWMVDRAAGRKRDTQAFIARMPSGHIGVFKRRRGVARKGGNRPAEKRPPWFTSLDEKLTELKGPSVPQVAQNSPRFAEVLRIDLATALAQRLTHEIDFVMQKLAKKGW